MAPSTRKQPVRKQQATNNIAFGRVTKSSKVNSLPQPKQNAKQVAALEQLLQEKSTPAPTTQRSCKRRRDEIDSEASETEGAIHSRPLKSTKKPKFNQLSTPPPSSPEPIQSPRAVDSSRDASKFTQLPETLLQLISLHKAFLRALSVHYAHHGSRTPAALSTLMPSMTRLWKKSTVHQRDVERILAIWEVSSTGSSEPFLKSIQHRIGPFRLTVAGIGFNARTMVEFISSSEQGLSSFDEFDLQRRYQSKVENVYSNVSSDTNNFVLKPLDEYPTLIVEIGTQTSARQEKASSLRKDVLKLGQNQQNQTQPDLSNLSLADPFEPKPTPPAIKSRTLSLFDRVRAKQLESNSSDKPTAAVLLRRRALARVSEITDTLRMKQAQKLSIQFQSNIHGSPSRVQAKMKVSFSVDALVREIKNSLPVPVPDEEIKECLNVLGREVPDTWCSIYEMGGVKCITLQGEGRSGWEMKQYCDKAFGA